MKLEQQKKSTTDEAQLIILGTAIDSGEKETKVLEMLNNIEEIEEISIDFEDWEHVLRIVCRKPFSTNKIIERIQYLGIFCYELPDN